MLIIIYLSQLTAQFQPFWHMLPSTILLLPHAFTIHKIIVCTYVHVCVDTFLSNNGGGTTTEHILSSHSLPPRQGETLHWQSAPLSPIMDFAAWKIHSIRVAPSSNFSLVARQLVKSKDRTGITRRMITSFALQLRSIGYA